MSFSGNDHTEAQSGGDTPAHGSDHQVNPEWWQASDDRWYPPELHPYYVATASNLPTASGKDNPDPNATEIYTTPSTSAEGASASASEYSGLANRSPGDTKLQDNSTDSTDSEPYQPTQPPLNRPASTIGRPPGFTREPPTPSPGATHSSRDTDIIPQYRTAAQAYSYDSTPPEPEHSAKRQAVMALISGAVLCICSLLPWGSGSIVRVNGEGVALFKVTSFDSNGEVTLAAGAILLSLSVLGYFKVMSPNLVRWFIAALGAVALATAIFSVVDISQLANRVHETWISNPLAQPGDKISSAVAVAPYIAIPAAATALAAAFVPTQTKQN